jgi:hypothetical protein
MKSLLTVLGLISFAFLSVLPHVLWENNQKTQKAIEAPQALESLTKIEKFKGMFPLEISLDFGGLKEAKLINAIILECEDDCDFPEQGEELLLTVLTSKGEEKWQVTHGLPGEDYQVKEGYRLVSCFCDQPECRVQSPQNSLYWVEFSVESENHSYRGVRVFYKK